MPLYDYECPACGNITERIAATDDECLPCPECGNIARRIITMSGVHCANEDAAWIRSAAEMADPHGGPHCRELIKNPTRANLKKWMRKEGLRHKEPGERPTTRPPQAEPPSVDKLMGALQESRRLEVRGR